VSKTICITGMHRSGTSLVTGWLRSCGLQIADGHLLGSDSSNPAGHFEDFDFLRLQEAVITLLDPKSKGWIIFPDAFLSMPSEHKAAAKKLVEVRNANYPLWGWKDPRTVLFLTEWKELIPSLKILLVWRSCAEVVASLIKRSRSAEAPDVVKLSLLETARLWQHCNARVCDFKRLYPNDTVLLPLDYVLTQDKATVELLNEKFGLGLRYEPIGQLYESNLLERQPGLQAQVMAAYPEVADMEETLAGLSDVTVNSSHPKAGHPLTAVFADAAATHLYLVEQERKIAALESQVAALNATGRERDAALSEASRRFTDLERGMAVLKETIASRDKDIAVRDREIAARAQTLTARDQQLSQQNERIAWLTERTKILEEHLYRIHDHPLMKVYRGVKRLLGKG